MSRTSRRTRGILTALVATLGSIGLWAMSADGATETFPTDSAAPTAEAQTAARAQAKMLHTLYASTLDALHHHFFRNDRSVLPARAMEDIFVDMERQTQVKAKWISVNSRPMSIDHEPRTDFEVAAARALSTGKAEFEKVEEGYLRRAAPIPLTAGCISCHVGFLARQANSPRLAGLVISVPLPAK